MARLPARDDAAGLWVVSVVMFIIGAIILPDQSDEPPPTVAGPEVVADEPEPAGPAAAEEPAAVALAEIAATQPDASLVPERAGLPSPQPPEPTPEQKLAALPPNGRQ